MCYRLIIVAKQLPVRASRSDNGTWQVEWDDARSFLSNLRVLKKTIDVKWVGAPGNHLHHSSSYPSRYSSR
jgi:hypothetical protein